MSMKEKILRGKEFRKTIRVEAYDDTIVIKPLTSAQFETLLAKFEEHGINVQDKESLSKSLYKNIYAMREVCKLGIADPEEAALVDDMIGGETVANIGLEILALTNSTTEEVADFFRTQGTKT